MDDKHALAARLFMEHLGGPHSRLILKDCIKIAILETERRGQGPAGELDNIAAASVVAIMSQIEEWARGVSDDRP